MSLFKFSVLQDPDNWEPNPSQGGIVFYGAPVLLRDGSILHYVFDAAEDADLANEQFMREMANIGVVNVRTH